MKIWIRGTVLGDAIRLLLGSRWLGYPEDDPTFDFRQATSASSLDERSHRDLESGQETFRCAEKLCTATKADKSFIIHCVYTFIVYSGSSIFIPSYEFMMLRYGVSIEVVQLTLAIYVVGYGVGPLIFSPLSEIVCIGRNPPYVLSFILFVIVSIILAVIDSFPAIVVLRFLQGFFSSPSLASGGASIQDMFSLIDAPYAFIFWVTGFYCGPALGPLLSAYAVTPDWRWPLWEIVLMSAPLLLVIICLLPETSHETILLRRAQRLRRFHPAVVAPAETKTIDFQAILIDALIKPPEIAVKDPAIAYMCVYSSLVYAIYYSFFEAFPIAYGSIYQMPQTTLSLIYLSLIVGIAIYSGSSFVVFQALIVHVPLSYPRYVASLYAASDVTRSITAAGFVMFARYMYLDLGIGKGVTV
ncbi:major facilitator superfamily domain-containing protein [Aspergillus pseudocaelatus]|uniref:Major facilitator superfamily domain-containing protein n=1 Tax=Aspergillus pseudocaelatus TaxID=1825620 RepID=A0ABQ6WH66_9EURO|nr:major facilitator superfamily domain-containing protein [Aspergillus pseudocaelatus]